MSDRPSKPELQELTAALMKTLHILWPGGAVVIILGEPDSTTVSFASNIPPESVLPLLREAANNLEAGEIRQ